MHAGLDIGGTFTKAILLDAERNEIARLQMPTNRACSADAVVDAAEACLNRICREVGVDPSSIKTCGIGVPGIVDAPAGEIMLSPSLGVWHRTSFSPELERRTGTKIAISNDAVCAGIGEAAYGAGANCRRLLVFTFGTAVGAAYLVDGLPHDGFGPYGGELGHIPFRHGGCPCSCGTAGCFEQYGSASALVRLARSVMREDRSSMLWDLAGGRIEAIEPDHVFLSDDEGDPAARRAVDRFALALSEGVGGLVNIFRPETVVAGGGLASRSERLVGRLDEILHEHVYASNVIGCPPVLSARLGSFAGAIGAAALTNDHEESA